MCPSQISKKMGMYFVRVRNYFKAEADCVEFIAGRAATLEAGLPDLRREIEECRALGMTTNVSQMPAPWRIWPTTSPRTGVCSR